MNGRGKKYKCLLQDTTVDEFYRFIAVIIFMGLISVQVLQDYWAEDGFFGQPFVKRMMSRSKFLPILWNLHISDPEEDDKNQLLKQNNDPRYNRLFKVKPLYIEMQHACPSFYIPGINICIDERMVASKAQIGLKQYIKDKDATIVHIYKRKGNKSTCDNHRGISLLCIARKILTHILLNRLHLVDNILPESQCGFRAHRSTIDMIFAAGQVQEKSREQNLGFKHAKSLHA